MEFSFTAIVFGFFYKIAWRWKHLGQCALAALPFYLFPLYFVRWTKTGYALFLIILLGYGNIKYFLLLFPFVLEEI